MTEELYDPMTPAGVRESVIRRTMEERITAWLESHSRKCRAAVTYKQIRGLSVGVNASAHRALLANPSAA